MRNAVVELESDWRVKDLCVATATLAHDFAISLFHAFK